MTGHEDRPTAATKSALMQRDIDTIKRDVAEIKGSLANQYVPNHQLELIRLSITELGIKIADLKRAQELHVTKSDFFLVRMIVFGLVGLVMLAFGKFMVDMAFNNQVRPEPMSRRSELIPPRLPDNTALRTVPDLSN